MKRRFPLRNNGAFLTLINLMLVLNVSVGSAQAIDGTKPFNGDPFARETGYFSIGSHWTASENVRLQADSEGVSIFPACSTSQVKNCIESIEYSVNANKESPNWTPAQLTSNVISSESIPECLNTSKSAVRTNKAPTYALPLAPHSSGINYVVSAATISRENSNDADQFRIVIRPINWETEPITSDWICPDGKRVFTTSTWPSYGDFPNDIQFKIVLNFTNKESNFRLFSGRAEGLKLETSQNKITISGSPGRRSIVQSDFLPCSNREIVNSVWGNSSFCMDYRFYNGGWTNRDIGLLRSIKDHIVTYKDSTAFDIWSNSENQLEKICKSTTQYSAILGSSVVFLPGVGSKDFLSKSSNSVNVSIFNSSRNMASGSTSSNIEISLGKEAIECLWGAIEYDENSKFTAFTQPGDQEIEMKSFVSNSSYIFNVNMIAPEVQSVSIKAECPTLRGLKQDLIDKIRNTSQKSKKNVKKIDSLLKQRVFSEICPSPKELKAVEARYKKLVLKK